MTHLLTMHSPRAIPNMYLVIAPELVLRLCHRVGKRGHFRKNVLCYMEKS